MRRAVQVARAISLKSTETFQKGDIQWIWQSLLERKMFRKLHPEIAGANTDRDRLRN
jgi:hypothetical protein